MMTSSELSALALAGSGGLVLGAAYHLALWWTVARGLRTRGSALWFPASLLLRLGGTIIGFYLIGAGRWERYLGCLAGFLVAQVLATACAPRAAAPSGMDRRAGRAA